MKIAWGLTGAGHLLEESVERIEELSGEHDVTAFVSGAAEEVLRMYGLEGRLEEACTGEYLNELLRESEAGESYSKSGRFALGKYDHLVVSPCTSNTMAKMAHGVSDTLVTNAFAQAGKARIPIDVVPVDLEDTVSETPYRVIRSKCPECVTCPPADVCPEDAFEREDGTQIVLELCTACDLCVEPCPHDAVTGGEEVRSYVRKVDEENAERLTEFEEVSVVESPGEFEPAFEEAG